MKVDNAKMLTELMRAYDRKLLKMKVAKMISILRYTKDEEMKKRLETKVQGFIDRLVKSYKYHSVYWNCMQRTWRKCV